MGESKKFLLNGQTYHTTEKLTLFDLVNYFNFNDSLIVLEHNHLLCEKKKWKNIFIKNQDKIEIVTIVGGG